MTHRAPCLTLTGRPCLEVRNTLTKLVTYLTYNRHYKFAAVYSYIHHVNIQLLDDGWLVCPECRDDIEFRCDNGRCIASMLVCNGNDDCADNSDEIRPCSKSSYSWSYLSARGRCSMAPVTLGV